jgi:flagellar basal-body rod protein FlgG
MRALYTAATGMSAQQLKIENIANNIANANTTGFKKVREGFEDLVYQQVAGRGATGDTMQIGGGARLASLSRDFRAGDTTITSSPTDLLIDGDGFFVVESPTGETLYTRDGHFRTDRDGNLTTQAGYMLQPNITVPEGGKIVIASDGTVSAELQTEEGIEVVEIGNLTLATFTNPEALQAAGGNFFRASLAAGEPRVGPPRENGVGGVLQYALEGSNVDVAEELVSMITAQRGYELSSKVIQTADEMLQTAVNLRR